MSLLIIDNQDAEISSKSGYIEINAPTGSKSTIPLSHIERVIIIGRAIIRSSFFNNAFENGISVLFIEGKRLNPTSCFYGNGLKDVSLKIMQYQIYSDNNWRKALSKELVLKKLHHQIKSLNSYSGIKGMKFEINKAANSLNQIISDLNNNSWEISNIMGLEGGASSVYFNVYKKMFAPSLNFTSRNRRPPKDPVNACLSLGYTMLHFEAVRELCIQGLDPMIGFYHDIASSRESLASDIIELYRCTIDEFVYTLFHERTIRIEHFAINDDCCLLGKAGRSNFYEAYFEKSKLLKRSLRINIRAMINYIKAAKI